MLYWDLREPFGDRPQAALGEKIGGGTTQAGSKTDGAIERQPTAANETELRTVGYSGDGEVIRFCTIEEEDEEEISEHEADGVQQDEVGEIASHVQPYQGQKQEEEGDNRARVAQEWDAIDQVGIGVVMTTEKKQGYPTTMPSLVCRTVHGVSTGALNSTKPRLVRTSLAITCEGIVHFPRAAPGT